MATAPTNGNKAGPDTSKGPAQQGSAVKAQPGKADTNSNVDETEDEKAEREEAEARNAGMKYASSLDDNPKNIESDADMSSAGWLVANGYAEMHAVQEGLDTYNYVLLTEDGKRALSTYNEEAE